MKTAYNISVDVPQVKGAPIININELREKIQEFVNNLYAHINTSSDNEISIEKKYSKRLQHLRDMSRKSSVTSEDVLSDDRLAYLLSK